MAGEVKVRQGGSGHGMSVITTAVNYTVLDSDDVVIFSATGKTATLPVGTAWRVSRRWVIKNSSGLGGSNTVAVAGGGTIEGAGSVVLSHDGSSIEVVCDGVGNNYRIISAVSVDLFVIPITRAINTTAPLTGGGNLSADRTLGITDFVASGASHARGAVPDPGAVAGTTKFLREDGTWAVPAGVVTGNIKWQPDTITSLLTTELNALAAGNGSGVGTEYNNLTSLFLFGMFQLDVTFGTAPTADTTVDLFLVPATDGTNYNNGSATVLPQNLCIGSWSMRNVTTQQLVSLWGIQLPPTKFKLLAFNNTNQAFPATGSTVKMVAYGGQLV